MESIILNTDQFWQLQKLICNYNNKVVTENFHTTLKNKLKKMEVYALEKKFKFKCKNGLIILYEEN